jgi:two-component system, response regulator PdtaR
MTTQRLQVALAHQSAESRNTLHAAVLELGHAVCFHACSGDELIKQSRMNRPDLIIVQEFLPDMNGLQAVEQLAGTAAIPAIVILDRHNGKLLEQTGASNVLAALQEPVRASDLIPIVPLAMQHFRRVQELRERIELLKAALDDEEP